MNNLMNLTIVLIALFINLFHSPFIKGEEEINLSDNEIKKTSKEDREINKDSEKKMTHLVEPGDTITSISKFYAIKKEQIMKLNNIEDEDFIYVGQILKLIHIDEIQEDNIIKKETKNKFFHIVQKGENLTEISNRYGLNLKYLIEINELQSPDSIIVGSRILLTKNNSSKTRNKVPEEYENINPTINFKKNYGPLTIQQTKLKKIGGRETLNIKNQKNKDLIISINCDKNELDVRIPGRKWRGWLPAEQQFEKDLIKDFCPNFD